MYTYPYNSPLGTLLLSSDEVGLTGVWFEDQKYYAATLTSAEETKQCRTPVIADTICWLDLYFQGKEPDFLPALHPIGSEFRQEVWKLLLQIPYGKTTTYGELARQLAAERGISRMSAQAVGGAVGHNPIAILIPCHRVIGSDGSLTGYAAGLEKKIQLLTLEHVEIKPEKKAEIL